VLAVLAGQETSRAEIADMSPTDPKYEEEVSGCTACVGLITEDKIYIVRASLLLTIMLPVAQVLTSHVLPHRPMLVIREASWASRAALSPCHLTTSRRMKVCLAPSFWALDGPLFGLLTLSPNHRRESPHHCSWRLRRFRPCQWQPCPVPCHRRL
jgi:hypothetical protein